jgi:hypothetical protein
MKTDVNILTVSDNEKNIFWAILKANEDKNRIRIQNHNKTSRIRNTKSNSLLILDSEPAKKAHV